MSRLAVLVPSFVVALAAPAFAVFHIAHISEVMSGVGADPTVQYVEINMESTFQNAVANTRLTAFNCDGTSHQVLMIVPSNVPNQGTGVKWIMASQSFAAASGITPDFTWNTTTDGSINPTCGMVCWGAPGLFPPDPSTWSETDPNQYVDCVAYGGYTGPTKTSDPDPDGVNSSSGTPTTLTAGDGSKSLTRISSTNDNLTDFALVCPPTPTNNAGMMGVLGCTTTTTTSTSSTSTTTTTMPSASKCTGAELKAAGKKASCKLSLYSKATAKASPVDTAKLASCTSKYSASYAKGVSAGDCIANVDQGTIETKVDNFVSDVNTTVTTGGPSPSKCQGSKLKAAGKKASCKLSLYSKAAAKNLPVDTAKLAGCGSKFTATSQKADSGTDCGAANGDTGAIETKVDNFVNDVKGTLAP